MNVRTLAGRQLANDGHQRSNLLDGCSAMMNFPSFVNECQTILFCIENIDEWTTRGLP
jgi:hypothetical protein